MDESIVKFLEQPKVGTLKLNEAIREGCKTLTDAKDWLNGEGCGCAVAAAAVGYGVGHPLKHQFSGVTLALVSKKSGLSVEFLKVEVEGRHFDNLSREQIADWLASQGY